MITYYLMDLERYHIKFGMKFDVYFPDEGKTEMGLYS
jgi:hypothetical protein